MTSGAIQHGVPTNVCRTFSRDMSLPADSQALTPKSAIITLPSSPSKILPAFISLLTVNTLDKARWNKESRATKQKNEYFKQINWQNGTVNDETSAKLLRVYWQHKPDTAINFTQQNSHFNYTPFLTPSTPAVQNCCCSKGSAPYWSNPPFLIFDIRALWRSVLSARVPECQKLKIVG